MKQKNYLKTMSQALVFAVSALLVMSLTLSTAAASEATTQTITMVHSGIEVPTVGLPDIVHTDELFATLRFVNRQGVRDDVRVNFYLPELGVRGSDRVTVRSGETQTAHVRVPLYEARDIQPGWYTVRISAHGSVDHRVKHREIYLQ